MQIPKAPTGDVPPAEGRWGWRQIGTAVLASIISIIVIVIVVVVATALYAADRITRRWRKQEEQPTREEQR